MIAVIDYGAGNLQSVVNALNYIKCKCIVTNRMDDILKADGAILPGVGSFGDSMEHLINSGVKDIISTFISTGKPFLGICLGLQLLFPNSQESPHVQGLNILRGSIAKIPKNQETLKIPHIGWNSLDIKNDDGLFKDINQNVYVYFVHSYYLKAEDKSIVSAQTQYGVTIDAAIQYKNIYATQFHPEKSGEVGLKMLKNFVNLTI